MDRNTYFIGRLLKCYLSLSARRAWIETVVVSLNYKEVLVALRKESVDRNYGGASARRLALSSLSARRAWIETHCVEEVSGDTWGRSPQGERG